VQRAELVPVSEYRGKAVHPERGREVGGAKDQSEARPSEDLGAARVATTSVQQGLTLRSLPTTTPTLRVKPVSVAGDADVGARYTVTHHGYFTIFFNRSTISLDTN
jgi:hypothetical protein